MKTITTIVFAILASSAVFPSGSKAESEFDSAPLDDLYKNPKQVLRSPASTLPEELSKEFIVSAPERAPAATAKSKKPQAKKSAKSGPQRRSRLPASIANGVELRVQYNKLNSMFWLVERASQFDLVYANSSGSKSSLGLTGDDFKAMHRIALGFQPYEGDISKCRDSSMQMHVVTAGQPERTVTMCVNTKGATAERLRGFSQSLAMLVR